MIEIIDNIKRKWIWSARKLNHPAFQKSLILDVGSGGNPHPYADILLEKYLDDAHRLHSIKIDRPIVLADAEKMPFKDRAFGYSFALHVLEHTKSPENFLRELQRVSTSGYIETPNLFYERLAPLKVHALEIMDIGDVLYIYRKPSFNAGDYIDRLNVLVDNEKWKHFFKSNPSLFHVCYKWKDTINFSIINSDQDLNWFDQIDPTSTNLDPPETFSSGYKSNFRSKLISALRWVRPKNIDLDQVLACPECKSELTRDEVKFKCNNRKCSAEYRLKPFPDFNVPL